MKAFKMIFLISFLSLAIFCGVGYAAENETLETGLTGSTTVTTDAPASGSASAEATASAPESSITPAMETPVAEMASAGEAVASATTSAPVDTTVTSDTAALTDVSAADMPSETQTMAEATPNDIAKEIVSKASAASNVAAETATTAEAVQSAASVMPAEPASAKDSVVGQLLPAEEQTQTQFITLSKPGKDVFVKNRSGEWIAAEDGMVILPGDEVMTAKNSSVEVILDGGKVGQIEIKEGSLFKILTAESNPVTGDKKTLLNLAVGKILVKAQALKGNSRFEVKTPTSIAGVRGTLFEVEVEGTVKPPKISR